MNRLFGCLLSVILLTSLSLHPAAHHAEDNTPCLACSSGQAVAATHPPAVSAPKNVSSPALRALAVPPSRPYRLPTQARAPPTSAPAS